MVVPSRAEGGGGDVRRDPSAGASIPGGTPARPADAWAQSRFIARSLVMERLLVKVRLVAPSDVPVLVSGESGTGKELVARAIHAGGPRARSPFVALNCAVVPEGLLEAELFGHERGAFTGADRRRTGRFQAAHGGTLFLDEVGELPPSAQAKLLRVLEEGVVEPLGTNAAVRVDVRVVSASHRDLRSQIAGRTFRQDLYYRIRGVELHVPSLRERDGDVPALVDHFVRAFWQAPTRPSITPRALTTLACHRYDGNVRELKHAIQHAVLLAAGQEIDVHHLPPEMQPVGPLEPARPGSRLQDALRQCERAVIVQALRQTEGSRGQAAAVLGISRKTLWQRMRDHRIAPSEIA